MIARVALPIPRAAPFDYLVPSGMAVEVGHRVQVPFGRRRLWGIVVALVETTAFAGRLLPIERCAGPVLPPEAIPLLQAVADESFVSLGLVLARLVPSPSRSRAHRVALAVPAEVAEAAVQELSKRAPSQARTLAAVLAGATTSAELREIPGAARAVPALVGKGLLRTESLPFSFLFRETPKEVALTPDQEEAVAAIVAARGEGQRFLLFGPAGAGKTEVYLRAAQATVERGQGAILLEPEISLLPQLAARTRLALGQPPALYFGELSPGERWRVWDAAQAGRLSCAVGSRSAVFLPMADLGLVVLDEEGEPAYKQADMAPYYHARTVAERRAAATGAAVVLGAAAPAVDTYFRAERGEIKLLALRERVAGNPPQVRVVPRGEAVIGPELHDAMARHLAERGQILLFINRMGFFTGAACRRCQAILRCPVCAIPLVFHLTARTFRCHACGRSVPEPACSRCGGTRFRLFGVGTERVEHEARALFPHAAVARLDTETAAQREQILSALARGELQILVGTQMVGKGLDFPNITLVGVVNADQLLSVPDFRAGERTYQLIAAAIGRAGRGERPGEVIVQSDQPDYYAIRHALSADYPAFYEEEIRYRKMLSYPPFVRLVRILVEGPRAEKKAAALIGDLTKQGVEALGPAPLSPRREILRVQILVRGREDVVAAVRRVLPAPSAWAKIDPDPIWIG